MKPIRYSTRLFCTFTALALCGLTANRPAFAQAPPPLTLRTALALGVRNHPAILSKQNYLNAAEALTRNTRNEYLPNVILSAQQSYGTINGQYGPLAAAGAPGIASAGPAYAEQNWNAAFGAAYLISANWELFSFGRTRSRIQLSEEQVSRDSADLEQARFVHQIKIASAYLNLLIARQLLESSQSNLERVRTLSRSVKARTKSGLNPGVDSSLVNAEVSRARLTVIDFVNTSTEAEQRLADLLNIGMGDAIEPDTIFFSTLPDVSVATGDVAGNPQLAFYEQRVLYARTLSDVAKRSILPGLSLFGVYQARASGFTNAYNPETFDGYSSRYWDGVSASRYNYVFGLSVAWNLMSPLKVKQQVNAQRFVAAGYQNEYDGLKLELQNQLVLAGQRIQNSLESAREAPVQYQAASDAYVQKNVLYKNGLTTIVELQQALYALNRAEVDQRVASINVWHALLMKAAASGDFDLFINQVR
jgi:outer membrane protein TolC